jgi:hypothetical protein
MTCLTRAAARLHGTDFRGIDLRRVILPKNPDLLLVADVSVLDRASARLASHTGEHDTTLAATILDHLRATYCPAHPASSTSATSRPMPSSSLTCSWPQAQPA